MLPHLVHISEANPLTLLAFPWSLNCLLPANIHHQSNESDTTSCSSVSVHSALQSSSLVPEASERIADCLIRYLSYLWSPSHVKGSQDTMFQKSDQAPAAVSFSFRSVLIQ